MRPIENKSTPIITYGVKETSLHTIEVNEFTYKAAMIGIYKDPILATIRELLTNAWDANPTGKIQVTLPNVLHPVFEVRDFGSSMTHEIVMGCYSTGFSSTKRDTNTAAGMIGIGGMAPLSVVDAFMLTCWKDGRQRSYSIFKNDHELPQTTLLDERESTEPTGTLVAVPVQEVDFRKYKEKLQEVLAGFDSEVEILGGDANFRRWVVSYRGDGWYTVSGQHNTYRTTVLLRQGCVLYPFKAPEDYQLKLNTLFRSEYGYNTLVIDYPIGSFEFTTSREMVIESPGFSKSVEARVKAIVESEIEYINKEAQSQPSIQKAYEYYTERFKHNKNDYPDDIVQAKWNGHPVVNQLRTNKMMVLYRSGAENCTSFVQTNGYISYKIHKDCLVIFDLKNIREGYKRVKTIASSTLNNKYVWVRSASPETIELFKSLFECVDIKDYAPAAISVDIKKVLCHLFHYGDYYPPQSKSWVDVTPETWVAKRADFGSKESMQSTLQWLKELVQYPRAHNHPIILVGDTDYQKLVDNKVEFVDLKLLLQTNITSLEKRNTRSIGKRLEEGIRMNVLNFDDSAPRVIYNLVMAYKAKLGRYNTTPKKEILHILPNIEKTRAVQDAEFEATLQASRDEYPITTHWITNTVEKDSDIYKDDVKLFKEILDLEIALKKESEEIDPVHPNIKVSDPNSQRTESYV